ncbi:MAG: hypothetical protein KZQ66_17445, partial [Candidatus Thiodiazotropha sp. (ex Lucinoma aequizonata)]|nr:hypothetical protein [Candidatus Thiodiazotropha sp. (ex Lucinoma aequizonata)]MCU7886897.1 hypothetical protein [Candidatus Thiodiazotropha sp. (ex Lucinoma aequizonata)]MCU7903545.1 hypothetical protein [Candidatus Thiodiazotropha sp. (ex Lucinoma aequizonata)]
MIRNQLGLELFKKESGLSPALRSALEILLVLVSLLLNRITLNSKNSSKPPSTDPNRKVTIQPILPWPTRLGLMHLHEIRFFALKK